MSANPRRGKEGKHHGGRKVPAVVQRGRENARPLMQPKPFRIGERLSLDDALAQATASPMPASAPPTLASASGVDANEVLRMLSAVATAIWRVKSKLDTESKTQLPAELRHLPRHVQAAWDALMACHIEVQDFKGQRYVPGMAVNVIAFQPMEGVGTEVIEETIKPSVFYADKLIQRADVIVARPLDHGAEPSSASEPPATPPGPTSTDGREWTGRGTDKH